MGTMMLKQIQAINYGDIPFEIRKNLYDEMSETGLFSVDKDSPFGEWLATQGFVFDHGDWGWIGIWN
jgi:hypothetical protein